MALFAQLLSFFISALKYIPWVVFLRGKDGKPHSMLQTKSPSCKAGHGLDCLIEDDLLTNESERMNHAPPANIKFWQLLASRFRSCAPRRFCFLSKFEHAPDRSELISDHL